MPQVVDPFCNCGVQRFWILTSILLDLERCWTVERARLHGLDRRGHGAEGRHQDHGRRRMERLGRLQDVDARASAHAQIADHDVERSFVQLFDGRVAVGRLFDFVARIGQGLGESAAKVSWSSAIRIRPSIPRC